MESASFTELKGVLDLYLAQYSATDKLWAYFSTVTLGVLGFSVGSDKVSKSFLEASIVTIGYLVFCYGNFRALLLSQQQLEQFAKLARSVAEKNKVEMSALQPFSSSEAAGYYWLVVAAVCFGILFITYCHRAQQQQAP